MVTKEIFKKYVKVQMSGEYNMIMEANAASKKVGCTWSDYLDILRNYSKYMVEFKD